HLLTIHQMSYRAFKRLLGETSLERKCRFLFGAGILLLITASFCLYAYQTEKLAKKQATSMGRLLVNWIITQKHLKQIKVKRWEWEPSRSEEQAEDDQDRPAAGGTKEWTQLRSALDDLALDNQSNLPEAVRSYQHKIFKPKARHRMNQPEDSYEA